MAMGIAASGSPLGIPRHVHRVRLAAGGVQQRARRVAARDPHPPRQVVPRPQRHDAQPRQRGRLSVVLALLDPVVQPVHHLVDGAVAAGGHHQVVAAVGRLPGEARRVAALEGEARVHRVAGLAQLLDAGADGLDAFDGRRVDDDADVHGPARARGSVMDRGSIRSSAALGGKIPATPPSSGRSAPTGISGAVWIRWF
jgi:hypothetical protein